MVFSVMTAAEIKTKSNTHESTFLIETARNLITAYLLKREMHLIQCYSHVKLSTLDCYVHQLKEIVQCFLDTLRMHETYNSAHSSLYAYETICPLYEQCITKICSLISLYTSCRNTVIITSTKKQADKLLGEILHIIAGDGRHLLKTCEKTSPSLHTHLALCRIDTSISIDEANTLYIITPCLKFDQALRFIANSKKTCNIFIENPNTLSSPIYKLLERFCKVY
jgi:hypothetical protein